MKADEDITATCNNCPQQEKLMKCSGCRKVSYCSSQCQRADWRVHKSSCASKEVKKKKEGRDDRSFMAHNMSEEEMQMMMMMEGGGIAEEKGPRVKLVVEDHPLQAAAKKGDVGEVEALLKRGEKIDALDEHGMSALTWACKIGNEEVVKFLVERGAR